MISKIIFKVWDLSISTFLVFASFFLLIIIRSLWSTQNLKISRILYRLHLYKKHRNFRDFSLGIFKFLSRSRDFGIFRSSPKLKILGFGIPKNPIPKPSLISGINLRTLAYNFFCSSSISLIIFVFILRRRIIAWRVLTMISRLFFIHRW